jgi:NADPH:quinone reductase-like Zn-dependent oxidoreductase
MHFRNTFIRAKTCYQYWGRLAKVEKLKKCFWLQQRELHQHQSSNNYPDQDSKVVLITGASSGIGAATATHFAEIGYKKFVLVDKLEDRLNEVKENCFQRGAKEVISLVEDLSKPELNVEKNIVETTANQFGQLDIVISNAGVALLDPARYVQYCMVFIPGSVVYS